MEYGIFAALIGIIAIMIFGKKRSDNTELAKKQGELGAKAQALQENKFKLEEERKKYEELYNKHRAKYPAGSSDDSSSG